MTAIVVVKHIIERGVDWMPYNHNSWPRRLLTWHGHRGGVRVPFQEEASPLVTNSGDRMVVSTRLIRKLQSLARDLAQGKPVPRFIFLVGGPGNGKSEAVQEFLTALDKELNAQGALRKLLRHEFSPNPLLQWCVDLPPQATAHIPGFFDRINRLVVIQDASASEDADRDAAEVLANYIVDLVTHAEPLPVFVCCVNRGMLHRCLRAAYDAGYPSEITTVLKGIIQATALGKEALSQNRPSCWPLKLEGHSLDQQIACWPLDMESVLLPAADIGLTASPLEPAFGQIVSDEYWQNGACNQCEAAPVCPFLQNAMWLQNEVTRSHLISILRRAELATGQRWNFRDMFSLVAELMVGDEQDFATESDPCTWVHGRAEQIRTRPTPQLAFELIARLYPNALFPVLITGKLPDKVEEISEIAAALEDNLPYDDVWSPTHIRKLLRERVAPKLDPALLSPVDRDSPLSLLEYSYSQSVARGNADWPASAPMSSLEAVFLRSLEEADHGTSSAREFAKVAQVKRYLRVFASTMAKRSVGIRTGTHAEFELLSEYEATIRDAEKLYSLASALRSLLEQNGKFVFAALGSFGQPYDRKASVLLQAQNSALPTIFPAPGISDALPAHDLPYISVQDYAIPLTFDLFWALRLRKDGFANSSLPASVRAAIDRIRHLIAGQRCRDSNMFKSQMAEFSIGEIGSIVLMPFGEGAPSFRHKEE